MYIIKRQIIYTNCIKLYGFIKLTKLLIKICLLTNILMKNNNKLIVMKQLCNLNYLMILRLKLKNTTDLTLV